MFPWLFKAWSKTAHALPHMLLPLPDNCLKKDFFAYKTYTAVWKYFQLRKTILISYFPIVRPHSRWVVSGSVLAELFVSPFQSAPHCCGQDVRLSPMFSATLANGEPHGCGLNGLKSTLLCCILSCRNLFVAQNKSKQVRLANHFVAFYFFIHEIFWLSNSEVVLT